MPVQKSDRPLRCGQCQRLLAVITGPYSLLHIKCPRCKSMNHFTHSH
ncbi:TPA: Com family DNA-binding transcriptional regulator [Salmonella enterica]|nr:Com family DNA-binding transcriptional regulator [Salmonella enterica]